jgi:hypothetical protein
MPAPRIESDKRRGLTTQRMTGRQLKYEPDWVITATRALLSRR